MENTTKSLAPAGAAKPKAPLEDEESELESDGSGEMDSGEELSESSDEEPPPPPPPPARRPPVRSNKKHNNIIRRIPHRDFLKQKRKSDALKEFHKFSKKMKLDTGLSIKTIAGGDIVELDELLSDSDESFTKEESDSSDGFSDPEFTINPEAALEPDQGNESFIDPETGAITIPGQDSSLNTQEISEQTVSNSDSNTNDGENKTLSISDIIDEGSELDLSKNVDIEEILGANQFTIEKRSTDLGEGVGAQEGEDVEYDITEKLKEMGEISVKSVKREDELPDSATPGPDDPAAIPAAATTPADGDDDKNKANALNVRRNIREVMDEKQLDASTLAAQRQESERLARVQEQQRIIREVRRQIALGRQEKAGASLLRGPNLHKLNLPGTVLVKLPSGEMKKTSTKSGQMEVIKVQKNKGHLTPSVSIAPVGSAVKKEVVEIVDSSSSSSSSSESPSSDSDDCIMLSDSELPPSPEPDEDPQNSGLHVNDAYNAPDEQGRVVINIGHPENEEDIFLAPQIGRIIKPHQIGGVRFLFDNIIESVERFSTSTGFGCILAHSMGLGKTLQIVCFCDIFLRHTQSKTVLCIMPINTLQNWVAEFNMWLPLDATTSPLGVHGEVRCRHFPIYVLNDSHKTLQARAKVIQEWTTVGGVLMIGYELYRLLSLKKNKKPRNRKKNDKPTGKLSDGKDKIENKDGEKSSDSSKLLPSADGDKKPVDITSADALKCDEKLGKEDDELSKNGDLLDKDKVEDDEETDEEKKLLDHMFAALVKPGPDLVICDEGHRIKNSHSNISYALKQMRTKRRIVLTGYPLQNNLLEYWCMVDFVRPNYLGTKTEFSNMFERPIQNGQCIDSTPQDIRLMRYRAHVLHSLLVGFVQRRSHAVLQSTLPQKEEYVLLVRMTDLQKKLYDTFMNEVVRKKTVPNPLKAFAVCCKVWNHPDVLYYFLKKREEMQAMIDYDLDIEDTNPAVANLKNKPGPVPRKGKPRTRATAKKGNDKTPLAPNNANSGKPAATIPPNTSNANPVSESYNAYDPNKAVGPNGPQYGYGQDMNQQSAPYPPYGYQQQQYPPQQNYYPQGDGYGQQYGTGYYPPQQPYGGEYNHYPQDPNNPSLPPPQQNYPHNPPYNPQGYWGADNNYYNNTNPDYYQNPNQGHTGYQNNQDPYNTIYDPYAQQTQPYHGFNQNRPYDRNVPNGEHTPQGFSNNPQNNAPYPAAPGPVAAGPFPMQAPPIAAPATSYDSTMYPGYQNPQSMPIAPDKSVVPPVVSPVIPSLPPSNAPIWPAPAEDSNSKLANNYNNIDIKTESKIDSDGEFKIADLDTMKVINDTKPEIKSEVKCESSDIKSETKEDVQKEIVTKAEVKENIEKLENLNKVEEKFTNQEENDKSKKSKDKSKHKDKKSKKGNKKSKDSKSKNEDESGKDTDEDKKDKEEIDLKKLDIKEEVPYEWANDLLKTYVPGIIENSAKMEIFFCILIESIRLGDRLLLFSQSLFTLNLIEDFLQRNYIPGSDVLWAKNKSYYRLDGSTSALEREKLINEFNSNPNIHLFLVSTRAGSLGINLVGANRVIVFDASWNPCHDTQAVCRVYRYGQKKPCFVYRLVMDNCLEKKIYDRQINKQGMADRVVDECNPDAVLSMKEVTNLCWDSEEKEVESKELEKGCEDKYLDVIMRKIIEEHARTLSKEPFQHESLLVDRKEKKLSSAEKRLAQRGYELEKKAAANPKPSLMYRTIRTADGSIIQRPVASVRPMPHGGSSARWIPAEVWQRQGMTAQEMTLPLDVVIPTNSAEKSNIVLKAGQRVMVLKSPKGIYMQLESGKIIAIKTSFKVGQGKDGAPGAKEGPTVKKVIPSRPANLPGSLKNNSAITVISKGGRAPVGLQKVMTRPAILQSKLGGTVRPFSPGQRIQEIKIRSAPPPPSARPISLIRGRAPPRPSRPIPIQNKLNIKIQQANATPNTVVNPTETPENRPDRVLPKPDDNISLEQNNSSASQIAQAKSSTHLESDNVNPEDGLEQSNDSSDAFEAGVIPNKALRPTLPEDVVSEDSSQEKTYVDLSDRSESKITTKTISKKSPTKPASPVMTDCKIPIKKGFSPTDAVKLGFMNELTIKRTSVPSSTSLSSAFPNEITKPAPVNLMADEVFPSEATLSEHKLPSSQTSSIPSADENSMEEDMMFKEKKMYKPNLIDRKVKINSLKNYRHPKSMQKPIPIQSEFNMGIVSPASTSSTPTPPPAPLLPQQSSLSQLEKTASSINRSAKPGGMSDFQQSLSEITKTYSPGLTESPSDQPVYKPGPKSRKKKPPQSEMVPDNGEMLSKPIPIDTSLMKQSAPGPAPYPANPYGEPSGLAPGFPDPAFHQPPPVAADPNVPLQPYNAYPGYPPPAGAGYPPYPGAPYYPQYTPAPAPYPSYPQYPPYPPNPYPGYPPQW